MDNGPHEEREENRKDAAEPRRSLAEPAPVFWRELYAFAVISLGGITLALLVLAPRLSQVQSAHDVESRLQTGVARLANLEKQYESAIQALDADPFYRDEVIRTVLDVKKNNEEFLKAPPSISDN